MKKRSILFTAVFLLACFFSVLHPGSSYAVILMDVDGNVYPTVSIDGKLWMGENLEVKHYRNGDPVRHAVTAREWDEAARNGEGAWCYYSNNSDNGMEFGILYNWYAVNDPRGLAPQGWHIPSDHEWNRMIDALGGKQSAGVFMKTSSSLTERSDFYVPGTYSDGFAARPGGYRRSDGRFYYVKSHSYFWTASKFLDGFAWFRHLTYMNDLVFRNDSSMGNGMSVRCVRDAVPRTILAESR
ncbi:MAG: fibrobacter succinogenes major paralogous domain-containing protein [Prosthecochloris sp.]|jgi:uncharacterized protein (TIGR02145 family)|nr:fibrobacter succinogenes major paralogous domain-containing protein [Prosthecochloris sp.]